jgi:formylglycine-generating enzyme required for sulfatase activity
VQARGALASFFVIDACRDNPFEAVGVRSIGSARGLARVDAPTGVFVLFSAGIGQTALDRMNDADRSPNSVFTRTLVPLLRQPGLTHLALAKRVQTEVKSLASSVGHAQQPAFYDQIDGEVVFRPVALVPPPVVPVGPCGAAPMIVSWSSRSTQPLSVKEECALKPQDVFKECDKCPEMVVVPAGTFTMGSPENEANRDPQEGPQHSVTISKPFAAGRFAVTFDEWDVCVADGGCNGYEPNDQGWGHGRLPVINVSWDDAKAYVGWLSRKTGKPYRLLSEAEREYAARAGTATPFWWGASISTSQANYDGTFAYGGGQKGEKRQRTVPVDSFQPNPWGLYQVHGNVWEWVEDCGHESYAGAPSDGSAWVSEDSSCRRVIRGGSWYLNPWYLRAAKRGVGMSTRNGGGAVGFRVARTL